MNHGSQTLQFLNKQPGTGRKCGTCWHLFAEPFIDHDGNEFTGCGNDRMMLAGTDPATGRALHSDIIATDEACDDYLTQDDGDKNGW